MRCAVPGCPNKSYAGCLISFHMFPRDEELKRKWLCALGKKSVGKYARVCHQHFRNEDFEFDTALRRHLKPHAIPSIFLGEKVLSSGLHVLSEIQVVAPGPSCSKRSLEEDLSSSVEKTKCVLAGVEEDSREAQYADLLAIKPTYNEKAVQVNPNTISTCTQTDKTIQSDIKIQTTISKRETLMKRKIRRTKKKYMGLKEMIAVMKKKNDNFIEIEDIIKTNFGSMENTKSKGLRHSSEVKKLALTIHFYSPKVYRFLRSIMIFPHPNTLRKMLRSNNCDVGFIDEVFNYLKIAVQDDKDIQNVALMFDAMSIRSQLVYDKFSDKHWGYVDLGGIATSDSEAVATEVLVFMIVSLKKKFKCPIGYFFINKISASLQATLVQCAIRMLLDVNINVRSVTCDGTGTNISTYEKLGCRFDENEFITSFTINQNKIYCLLDPPHMLKLARNAFAETKIQSDKGDICFEYIKKLNEVQNEENMRFANRLTTTHINFTGKKMNVKLASQLLSSSVADAVDFLKASGNENFNNSSATVEFIRLIDRIFDIMNAKNPFGQGFKSALRIANKDVWTAVLRDTRNYLISLKIDGHPILKHRRKTFALGFIVNSLSFTALAEDFLMQDKWDYFLPYKCSQDHLEMLFSCIRSCGGNNNNPNALQFKYTLRKLLYRNSVTPSLNGNCFSEDYENSPILEFRSQRKNITNEVEEDDPELIQKFLCLVENKSISNYQENILYYITGYIVKKIVDRNYCEHCQNILLHNKESMEHLYAINVNYFSTFTAFVNRGGLCFASRAAFEVIKFTDKCIKAYGEVYSNEGIRKKIVNLAVQKFSQEIPNLFIPPHPITESITCGELHELQLIKFLSNTYAQIKLAANSKNNTLKLLGSRATIRQKLHKIILFSHV